MYGNFLFNFAFKKLQECTLQKNLSMAEEDVIAFEMRFKKRMLRMYLSSYKTAL